MSTQRSTRYVLGPALVAVVPLWLADCGGTAGPPTSAPSEIGMNTPYYVMPIQAADGTLPASVNDPGPAPLTDADIAHHRRASTSRLWTITSRGSRIGDPGGVLKSYTYNDSMRCEVMPVACRESRLAKTGSRRRRRSLQRGSARCGSVHAMHLAG